jgi:solute carrier family 13 (sodium-dependent dicarboxylate transporter), member 2/3/5
VSDETSQGKKKPSARLGGSPYSFVWNSSWNALVLQLSILSLLILVVLPAPASLGLPGLRSIGIFTVCFVLWITNALPIAITGLLAISLIALYRVLPAPEAFALFGNTAVFFILGAFILAAAIMKSGLSKRAALWMLARFGHGPRTLITGVFLIAFTLSLFMSEHAVAAALLPVILELVEAAEETKAPQARKYGRGLLFALIWGTVIGGTGTLLGGARAPLALGILKRTTGEEMGFFEYSQAVFPITATLALIGLAFLMFHFGNTSIPMARLRGTLREQTAELGPVRPQERGIALVFVLTVVAWIWLGHRFDLATIAILSAVSLFLFRLTKWEDTEEYINWGILLMYGGAIALGTAFSGSGAAAWMASSFLGWTEGHPMLLLATLSLFTTALTEGMSNSAAVALLLPLGLGMLAGMDISGTAVAVAIAFSAGLGYIFPTGAPAIALAFTSNRLSIRDMIVIGLPMSIISWTLIVLAMRFYWPRIGLLP